MSNSLCMKNCNAFMLILSLVVSMPNSMEVSNGKVTHFLCHNAIFYKMSCIYMLFTCHKVNNMPNLWLDLVFQFELYIYITYMHQIYNNGVFKLKNMDWFSIYASPYMHFFVWFWFGTFYSDSICDILKQ
jgi:hypothetical protein